ncbi:MAG: hypothetical protein U1F54_20865 [Burkholderiales bacterium]
MTADTNDWMDDLLREDAAESRDRYVADDGFTMRVMDALPAPAALPRWRKPAVAALWGIAAAGVAVAAPGAVVDVAREAYRLLATVPVSIAGIAGAMAAIVAVTGAAAAYTLGKH